MPDFSTHFTTTATPRQVAAAIDDVRGWWSGEIEGSAGAVGDTFTYRWAELHHSTQQVARRDVDRIEWTVMDGGPRFTDIADEWKGTTIRFDLAEHGGTTVVTFTHVGLTDALACYEACTPAWAEYVEALQRLSETGSHNDTPPAGA